MFARMVAAAFVLPFVAIAAVSAPAPAADRNSASRWTHTRCLSGAAANMVTDAIDRSPLVRTLVGALEKTSVVVYVSLSMSGFSDDFHGSLTFVAAAAGIRYLHVAIDSWGTTPDERIVLVGHELQHALEVAAAPWIGDQSTFARFYRQSGRPARGGGFETAMAQETGRLVRHEISPRGH